MKTTNGYKVTDKNMMCRDFQFALNVRFNQPGELSICNNGFHFCELPQSCFNYYEFSTQNRVFEVLAYGDVEVEGDKSCCLQLEFIREVPWQEVIKIVNTGAGNSGHSNSGDRNSGDRNSGDRNSGDRNSGHWNSGYRNSGAFCTDNNPKLLLFNKESSISVREWESHAACQLMYTIDPVIWVPASIMSEEEKDMNPKWESTGGYLKTIPIKEAWANFWHNLTDEKRTLFTSLENFDADIFFEITGIKV